MALAPVTEQTAREDADTILHVARTAQLVDDELAQLIAAALLLHAGTINPWEFSARITDLRLAANHRKGAAAA